MKQRACDLARLITDWEQALGSAPDGNMVEQVAASQLALPRDLVFRNTILAVLWQALPQPRQRLLRCPNVSRHSGFSSGTAPSPPA